MPPELSSAMMGDHHRSNNHFLSNVAGGNASTPTAGVGHQLSAISFGSNNASFPAQPRSAAGFNRDLFTSSSLGGPTMRQPSATRKGRVGRTGRLLPLDRYAIVDSNECN